jgi:hypothetical protein
LILNMKMPLVKLGRRVLTVILLLKQHRELIIAENLMLLLLILPRCDQLIRRCVPDVTDCHPLACVHHPFSNSLSELPFLDFFL